VVTQIMAFREEEEEDVKRIISSSLWLHKAAATTVPGQDSFSNLTLDDKAGVLNAVFRPSRDPSGERERDEAETPEPTTYCINVKSMCFQTIPLNVKVARHCNFYNLDFFFF